MTPSQMQSLREAIAADPSLQALANVADDIALAVALNNKTIDGAIPVPTAEVKRQAILQGYFGAIVLASRGTPSPVSAAAIAAVGYVDDVRYQFIDLTLPAVQAMIAALVTGSVMTQDQANALNAMGSGKISKAEQICGLGTVITDAGALR